MAAFMSPWENHDPAFYHCTIKSMEDNKIMKHHRTTVCLRIARVEPDESHDRRQEMWVLQANDRRDVRIYCIHNEWKQLQHPCEHAKECRWATFLAQMLQEEHDKIHLQLAEQTTPDHFIRALRDPEYWRRISYQERNNNSLLSTSMKFVVQLQNDDINIIECATKLGRLESMYYAQTGMFDIPVVKDENLNRLHAMAFGIPRIDDEAYKCSPKVGELFTNQWGDAPDWVLLLEGYGGARRTITPWPASCEYYPPAQSPKKDSGGRTDENIRLPIQEGCLISE